MASGILCKIVAPPRDGAGLHLEIRVSILLKLRRALWTQKVQFETFVAKMENAGNF